MENENNYFKKLNTIAGEVEKKQSLSYISWATAWEMTKKEFPDATYEIYENQDGNAFWETKFGIDCKVGVTINGIEHIVRLPVMDGANKAMKAESYTYKTRNGEKTCEAATQFDINKAIQRAFTKAMAMHGIGLYVYRGEDLPEVEKEVFDEKALTNFTAVKGNYESYGKALIAIERKFEINKEMKDKVSLLYNK